MEVPTKEQEIYAHLALIIPQINFIRDQLLESEFDDLELISRLDKTRFMAKGAKLRMDELIEQSRESRGCC